MSSWGADVAAVSAYLPTCTGAPVHWLHTRESDVVGASHSTPVFDGG